MQHTMPCQMELHQKALLSYTINMDIFDMAPGVCGKLCHIIFSFQRKEKLQALFFHGTSRVRGQ